jgi:hypothetical protein
MTCVGCSMSAFDTLREAAGIYDLPLESLLAQIQAALNEEPGSDHKSVAA